MYKDKWFIVSKIYMEYLKRKKIDNDKYYLFRSGMFYIFIDEDARKICKITLLKLTNLSNDIVKCGFPSNSLDKYLSVFKNMGLDVLIVDDLGNNENNNNNNNELVIRKIKRLDIDNITPVKALNILNDLKGMLKYE